ncbi:MAG: 3-hydroxybutyryl-CoA dehydrogenase [Chloroflexi bacterium RBG_13_54_8]|nr:MAG: 3-hydroxybutyryl-CoA dehydrogenase [Chloroflexi bacterium RBG_13_54_8]
MEIKKVGVVGCGLMGGGITEVCAKAGYDTVVLEVAQQFLDKGTKNIATSLDRAVKREKMTAAEKDATLGRIRGTLKMEDFADRDLVIEAAIENLEEKKRVFAGLDKICPPHAFLASNTSCLSVLDMAMMTKRPDRVLGLHFFSPVPIMRLVEIVKTLVTSDEAINMARVFCKSIDKETVLCQDAPGFIANRLSMVYLAYVIRFYEQGMATKEDIDKTMRLGLNHPMGPLELADFIGLDTVYYILTAMHEELKDPLFAPPTILKKMVTAGHLGRKTGKGFYTYK